MGSERTTFRTEKLRRIANAAPYGIIAVSCAIAVFFATVGFVVAHLVLSGIAAATNSVSPLFENWWQVLIFVADILFFAAMLASLTMFIIRVILNGRARKRESAVSAREAADEN